MTLNGDYALFQYIQLYMHERLSESTTESWIMIVIVALHAVTIYSLRLCSASEMTYTVSGGALNSAQSNLRLS